MDDLDEWILSLLADQESHSEMMAALDRKAGDAERAARGIRKRTGVEGDRRRDALSRVERIGRILSFLHHGLDAHGATDADKALCTKIKEQLTARGVWAPPEKH